MDPIEAKLIAAQVEGDDVIATVELDPRDYLRQDVQYGGDIYEVLTELKGQLSPDQLTELVAWARAEPLTQAIIQAGPDGIDSWQAPAPGL